MALNRGLMAAADLVEGGERDARGLVAAVCAAADAAPGLAVEYVTLASQDLVQPLEVLDRPAFLALAAWSGKTRLIDNVHLDREGGEFVADRGVRLTTESVLYRNGEG